LKTKERRGGCLAAEWYQHLPHKSWHSILS